MVYRSYQDKNDTESADYNEIRRLRYIFFNCQKENSSCDHCKPVGKTSPGDTSPRFDGDGVTRSTIITKSFAIPFEFR